MTGKYSIYAMPQGEVRNKLQALADQLSETYKTPKFEPHVTIIPNVVGSEEEIIAKTEQLAKLIKPYKVELREIGYGNTYFQCLFIKGEATPEVIAASNKAREVFDRFSDPPYDLHLSIMYGENCAADTKEEIIRKIGRSFNLSFLVDRVYLYTADGSPEEWHRVKEFPLKNLQPQGESNPRYRDENPMS